MIKYFYKKSCTPPTFFDSRLKIRFTAYGEEVKRDFLAWRNAFYKSWNNKCDNMLICEQGDIGGNAVRADSTNIYVENLNVTKYQSESVLPLLWWSDKIFEVARDGAVRINKDKSALNIGSELKAWALVALHSERMRKSFLVTIGKPLGVSKTALTVYDLAATDVKSSIIDQVDMPITLNDKSFLSCFGRHIFAVHESTLNYFYLNKQLKLERCAIGADKENTECEWCNGVLPRVVCDGEANVFWVAQNRVYGFTIGAPRNVFEFGCPIGYKISKIACFDKILYVFLTDKRGGTTGACYAYRKRDGIYESALLNKAACNLITEQNDNSVKYIKITQNDIAETAEYSFIDKKEKLESKIMRDRGDAFCCFGGLASARYVGFNNRKPVAIV